MGFGDRCQRLSRDTHVAALVIDRRRLMAFQKRISAKGDDNPHRSAVAPGNRDRVDCMRAVPRLAKTDGCCRANVHGLRSPGALPCRVVRPDGNGRQAATDCRKGDQNAKRETGNKAPHGADNGAGFLTISTGVSDAPRAGR